MQVKKQADTAEGKKAADELREFEVKRIKVRLPDALGRIVAYLLLASCKRTLQG